MDKLISIGKILNFHGIHGEARVGYTEGKEGQLESFDEFFVEKGEKLIKLTPESIRFHKKYAIIKFKELSSVNDVVELKGCLLRVAKLDLTRQLEKMNSILMTWLGLMFLI